MIIDLSLEAADFGRVSLRALEAAGGDKLVRLDEQQPERRGDLVCPVLAELGVWDLSPGTDPEELEAAAAVCRSAGWWGLSYPVAERLSRPTDVEADGLVVVSDHDPSGTVGGLGLQSLAVTLDGQRSRVHPGPGSPVPRTSAFVTTLDLEELDRGGSRDVGLALLLTCWTLLGFLDRAMTLTQTYVREREQFNKPLASFQGVQFQLTDAEVERAGFEELAKYALWSVQTHRPEAADDGLALRLAGIEAADTVFRIAHQLHGAIGFCDETTLSWLSRYSQPLRRLPYGLSGTRDQLLRRVGRRGLTGLFTEETP